MTHGCLPVHLDCGSHFHSPKNRRGWTPGCLETLLGGWRLPQPTNELWKPRTLLIGQPADPFGKPNFGFPWQYLQHFSIAAAVANITTCCLGYHSNASVATIVLLLHSDVSLRKLKRHTWFQRRCITHGIIY